MITGLKVSKLTKTKNNSARIFKQIEYNIKKSHLVRAFNKLNLENTKFTSDTINCVRKIQNTPNGQKVLQIVSHSLNSEIKKPKYYWIKEQKFLSLFESFMIISKRNKQSQWTNKILRVKNQQKAVYMMQSQSSHISGSITIYPINGTCRRTQQKCTIAFYKQIQPYVLKLVGKASQKLPQNPHMSHNSKLYFEFNIKGNYYVFFELQDGEYNIAMQSNSNHTQLEFVQYVKKQNNKNQQCQYVQIDKMLKKKNNPNTIQKSDGFKKLMNFMKKTNPHIEEATK